MEAVDNIKLVHHTALAFTVEHDNEQIQAIRAKHDPAFGRWQPHINFCFPFVDTPAFEQTFNVLQERFNHFPAFDIVFRALDSFPHGTVFLNPETTGNQL
jgi:poly(A) polymerase